VVYVAVFQDKQARTLVFDKLEETARNIVLNCQRGPYQCHATATVCDLEEVATSNGVIPARCPSAIHKPPMPVLWRRSQGKALLLKAKAIKRAIRVRLARRVDAKTIRPDNATKIVDTRRVRIAKLRVTFPSAAQRRAIVLEIRCRHKD